MKGDCRSYLVFCMLLRLEEVGNDGGRLGDTAPAVRLGVNEEDLDELVKPQQVRF